MKQRRLAAVAGVAILTFLVASCSSVDKDDSKGESSTTVATTRTTRGITDTSIKVGGVMYGVYFGDSKLGVEARLKQVNDAGGVHGRKIEFVGVENDGNDPTKNSDIITALVEKDKVFALLPVMSAAFNTSDYITEQNVPAFGWGINPGFCEGDIAFGVTGCVTDPDQKVGSNALGTALEDMFDGKTDKTIAFLAEDNDAGKGGLVLLTNSVEDVGFEVVSAKASLPAPPQQPGDVSPFVKDLMSSDDGEAPDMIYLQATLSGTAISNGLQQAGYKGMIIMPSFSPLLLNAPGYNGISINTQFGMDPALPANADMMKAVHEIDPDAKMSLALLAGYYSADMFIAGLEKTGKDLTVESLLATLHDGFTYSVTDVIGESTWPANHSEPVPCSAMSKVENNEFTYPYDLVCGATIEITS